MGVAVHVQKVRCVHGGVNLRGRQARVPKQLLERAEIGSTRQQVRCETVPKRMRREGLGQAQAAPRSSHRATDEVRIERASARTDEQRQVTAQRIRAL